MESLEERFYLDTSLLSICGHLVRLIGYLVYFCHQHIVGTQALEPMGPLNRHTRKIPTSERSIRSVSLRILLGIIDARNQHCSQYDCFRFRLLDVTASIP